MSPPDLLDAARLLARSGAGRPKQANLKRAISTAYYAVFHQLAGGCADAFIGKSKDARASRAWRQTYRALQHGAAKDACKRVRQDVSFPPALISFAVTFVILQERRHSADYDPHERVTRRDALREIERAEQALTDFEEADARHQRAFCAFMLLGRPRN